MYTLGVIYDSSLPAWKQWQPGKQIDPYEIPDEIIATWRETEPGKVGYNTATGCYCWGYRPKYNPARLDGIRWADNFPKWKICTTACTCPVPPPVAPCPTPAPCPVAPPCPTTQCTPDLADIDRSKNWLWLAGFGFAVAAVYGVRRTMQLRRKGGTGR